MIPLFKPLKLETEGIIKALAEVTLKQWNFKTERLLRLPLSGQEFDSVNEELERIGIGRISVWTIFARGAGEHQNIHKDAAHAGLIIPILGTANSKMQWFDESAATFKKIFNPDGKTFYYTKNSVGTPPIIFEMAITETIIANVSVPHRAVAGDTPRAVVSIKMAGNPKLL